MKRQTVSISGVAGIGLGVFWVAWGKFGFWWGLAYGLFWVPWVGARFAMWLLP